MDYNTRNKVLAPRRRGGQYAPAKPGRYFIRRLLLAIVCAPDETPSLTSGSSSATRARSECLSMPRERNLQVRHGDISRTRSTGRAPIPAFLPCASCRGIETLITLRKDAHLRTFVAVHRRTARRANRTAARSPGAIPDGTITLNTGDDETQQYQAGENALAPGPQRRRITGDLASQDAAKHLHDPAHRGTASGSHGTARQAGRVGQAFDICVPWISSPAAIRPATRSSGRYAIKQRPAASASTGTWPLTTMACPEHQRRIGVPRGPGTGR